MAGTLYLIPTPLGNTPLDLILPEETRRVAATLDTFVVEHAKTARAFLKLIDMAIPLQQLTLLELNEHSEKSCLKSLLQPLLDGKDMGLLSEAGCPAVADPGSDLVRLAHRHHIRVKPMIGPSSILLALMASGLGGQRFSFHGYLPSKPDERVQALRNLEKQSAREASTQIFIETPYRNEAMLLAILGTCHPDTHITLAWDITLPTESILTKTVADWRSASPTFNKHPCVFLLSTELSTGSC